MANPTAPTSPIVAWAADKRTAFGYVLAGLGGLFVLLAFWWGLQWNSGRPSAPSEPTKEEAAAEPKKETEKKPALGNDSGDYLPATAWAVLMALTAFGGATWNLSRSPEPGKGPTEARMTLMMVGALWGLYTALLGFILAWRWQRSILLWINQGETEEAKWVLAALAIFFVGLLLLFVSVQFGRAEERTNALVRRMLYGSNAVLSGLLLLMVLAVVNVFAYAKLPDNVITTAAAFKGLGNESREFLKTIDQPVRIYLVLPENYVDEEGPRPYLGLYADCRALLRSVEEANSHIKAVYLTPANDSDEIRKVQDRLDIPKDLRNGLGMLIGFGENEKPSGVISVSSLLDYTREGEPLFQGENRLMTELNFLSGGANRPVVYFTQGNGELSITPGKGDGERSCAEVVQYLKDRKIDVKPLKLEVGKPIDVTDATLVVIPGPTIPFSKEKADMLRQYMTPPAKGAKGGKILAFLPATAAENGTVATTGLEGLFEDFGVKVEDRRLFGFPDQGFKLPPTEVFGILSPEMRRINHLITPYLQDVRWRFGNVRTINALASRDPSRVAMALLTTPFNFLTYRDTKYASNPEEVLRLILRERKENISRTQNELNVSDQPVSFAAFSSAIERTESGAREIPRVVAVGTDWPIDDAVLRQQNLAPENYKRLFAILVDWARERPQGMNIEPRAVGTFTLPKETDEFNLYYMPLLLLLIGIVGLGSGVWLARRR